MKRNRLPGFLILLMVVSGLVRADVLFESDEVFDIEITTDFAQMRKDRDKSESYPGTLRHQDQSYDIELGVRGNKRLDKTTCKNPPLWVDFDKEQIKDTYFDKQKSIKLVVLCKKPRQYQDWLRMEYLVYRLYGLVTPYSYRVRWVNVTYNEKKPRTEPAFFIERKSRLAKRVGLSKTDVERIKPAELVPDVTAIASLFQYIISNPDYSLTMSAEGTCCHNAKLLMTEEETYVPVIYDFDSSGVINTSYAVPNQSLKISSVTQRLYRGYCRHNEDLTGARGALLALEDQMNQMLTSDPVLSPRSVKKMSTFLGKSFDILKDDKKYERNILKACRGRKV